MDGGLPASPSSWLTPATNP